MVSRPSPDFIELSGPFKNAVARREGLDKGYGVGSLDRDAKELRDLAVYLKEKRSCEEVAVMGHSTGCQDAVRLIQRYGKDEAFPKLTGIILQAAVCLLRSLYVLQH